MRRVLSGLLATAAATLGLLAGASAQAPVPVKPDFAALAAERGAPVYNRTLTSRDEDGRTVALLDAKPADGGVVIGGVQMGEGVIEVDLRGKDVPQRSFLGIAFHLVDWTEYEAVYFRPFNFRAATPEQRSHAVQYIAHPANPWQRLRTERPGQFEKAIDPPPHPNGWFHARIVLAASKVEVYVNGAAAPSLVVDDLGEATSGGVALWAGNGSDGAYAALTITPTAPPGPPPASRQTMFDAARTGNLERLKVLVEADPRAIGARMLMGATPLHLAAAADQRPAAEYLISKGASINDEGRHCGTPLDMAYDSGDPEAVTWLESKGARFTPIRFDVGELSPAVRRITFPWGMRNNLLAFSTAEGAVVVDSGFSARAVEDLKKLLAGFSPKGVRYLVNSHLHGDHVAGNALTPDQAAIVTAASLPKPPAGLALTPRTERLMGRSGRTLPAGYTWRVGGTELLLIPRPGLHSDADLLVYSPRDGVVAMGDLLLSESVPALGDLTGYLAFLDDVLDVFPEKTTFVSGHGRDLDAKGVRAYRDDLDAMMRIVRTNLDAGRTVEQMMDDDVLKAFKPRYSLLAFLPVDAVIGRTVALLERK